MRYNAQETIVVDIFHKFLQSSPHASVAGSGNGSARGKRQVDFFRKSATQLQCQHNPKSR